MKQLFVRACTVVAVFSAAATGCAAQDSGRPVEARPERDLTQAEQLRISDANEVLIKQCMTRAGFSYWTSPRLSLEESRTLGYVADDVDWARKHGYGSRILAKEERARHANPNLAYRTTLSQERQVAFDTALDGGRDAPVISADVPSGGKIQKRVGGCAAEAEKRLYVDLKAWFTADKTASNLRPLYVPKVLRDKQFTAALKAWSQCMKRAGHPYSDPSAARQATLRQAGGARSEDQAFAAEKQLAIADATCARDTSLRAIGTEREAYYMNKLRGQYGEALDTSLRMRREALARAVKIVGPRT
ncbi:hypothetical protein Q5762_10245 [Streptomyces sp. P9(2023)]|uniref:hypothetical protein n=1 Tax=Streptomyces sp. P9(2023) TaxID=3064394 RepID=UPI0028F424AD|nr:hypothetical protein [Streptomyces sp. P9(2023)]MDT9688731.1 hypothetical protein [Streptomyces sp. P9(2023)]